MIPTQTEARHVPGGPGRRGVNALNRIDGVLEARTIVMIPEINDLSQPEREPQPSASVLVKYRPSKDGKPPLDEQRIKQFVSTVVPKLTPETVTVIMSPAGQLSADMSPGSRLQDVLGIKMTAASASQFKVLVGAAGLLIVAMAALTAWVLLRSPGAAKSKVRG